MSLLRFRPAAILLVALHLASCTRWTPVAASPRRYIEAERPSPVRITTRDDARVVLRDPIVDGDSIRSCGRMFVAGGGAVCETPTRGVALDDVLSLDVRGLAPAGAIVGAAGVLGVLVVVVNLIQLTESP